MGFGLPLLLKTVGGWGAFPKPSGGWEQFCLMYNDNLMSWFGLSERSEALHRDKSGMCTYHQGSEAVGETRG